MAREHKTWGETFLLIGIEVGLMLLLYILVSFACGEEAAKELIDNM